MNWQVNMCCLVLKASASWFDGYHTPSRSTKQRRCSIYRDLLENSWLREWSEAVPALWSLNSRYHGPKNEATSSSTTTSSLLPDFSSNPFFPPKGMLSVCVVKTLFQSFYNVLTDSQPVLMCILSVFTCLLWVKQSLDAHAVSKSPTAAVKRFYWQNTKKEPQPKNDDNYKLWIRRWSMRKSHAYFWGLTKKKC